MNIKQLYSSAKVEHKIWKKHYLSVHDVERSLCREDSVLVFATHKKHGKRGLVETKLRDGSPLIVWLQPIDAEEGMWSLITAYVPK